MNARDLLAAATPRPWVGKRDDLADEIYTEFFAINETDDHTAVNIAGSDEDCALIVAAVNEYEALLYLEETIRAQHGDAEQGARMGCQTCDALARLDAVRSGT